jgi:hypothetical protein
MERTSLWCNVALIVVREASNKSAPMLPLPQLVILLLLHALTLHIVDYVSDRRVLTRTTGEGAQEEAVEEDYGALVQLQLIEGGAEGKITLVDL